MDDLDLTHLLDGDPGPEPTPAALESVMRRHRRAGTRTLVGALGIALVAGPLGGFVLARATDGGGNGDGAATVAAASASGSADAANFASAADAVGAALAEHGAKLAGGKLTHAFDRTVDGITIRAYEREITLPTPPAGAPAIPATCKPTGALVGEFSTDAAVGTSVSVLIPPSQALEGVRIALFGAAEGKPVATAIAKVGAAVTKVRFTLADGSTDEMAPDNGWVALAHRINSTGDPKAALEGSKLEAFDAAGNVVATHNTSDDQRPEVAPECRNALRGKFREGGPKRRPGGPGGAAPVTTTTVTQ
jgi:hypothetical protein